MLPPGCNDSDVTPVANPASMAARDVRDLGFSTVSDSCVTTRRRSSVQMSSAIICAIASQSRAVKCATYRSTVWLAAFSSRGVWRLQLLKSGDRVVDGCLVEDFAAVDHVAFDRENADHPPLGVETLLGGLIRHVGHDPSEVVQPVHRLDEVVQVRRDVPCGGE